MPTVLDDLGSLPDRIAASTERITDLAQQLREERGRRNELIVQAVDHAGMSQAKVAKIAGVSQPHLIRILAGASED